MMQALRHVDGEFQQFRTCPPELCQGCGLFSTWVIHDKAMPMVIAVIQRNRCFNDGKGTGNSRTARII